MLCVAGQLGWARGAQALAVAYRAGELSRIVAERAIVEWDPGTGTESIVLQVDVDGDAVEFGLLLATPRVPVAVLAPDDAFAALVSPGDAATKGPRVDLALDGVGLGNARALSDWLAAGGFAERPTLRAFVDRALSAGAALTAVRCTRVAAGSLGSGALPALKISFHVPAPVYPFAEPSPDVADEIAFRARHAGAVLTSRRFDLWFVGHGPVRSAQGDFLDWPAMRSIERAGDRVVTHFHDDEVARPAFADLTFSASPDASPPAAAAEDTKPDAGSTPALRPPASPPSSGGPSAPVLAALIAALVVAGAFVAATLRRR